MNSSHPTTRPSSPTPTCAVATGDAASVIGPIIDDPAFYHLVPERFIDQTGRIADDAYQEVLRAAINDLYYFGPLEDLLYDESLSEIMVNGPESVWVERSGRLMLTDVCFEDDDHVKFTIDRIAAGMNRRCDEASPLCDCTIGPARHALQRLARQRGAQGRRGRPPPHQHPQVPQGRGSPPRP